MYVNSDNKCNTQRSQSASIFHSLTRTNSRVIAMSKKYTQLTEAERYHIYTMKKQGYTDTVIAQGMGRDRTTIWRELHRNTGQRGYRRPALAAPDNALYLKPPHQSLYRTTCHAMAFSLKLTPDLPGAVHLVILIPHAIDRLRQRLVPLHPGRYACRVRVPGLVLVVRRRGDRHACISARPLAQTGVGR